jgi:hypothetical protein
MGTKDQPRYPGVKDRTHAHETGFNGNDEGCARNSVVVVKGSRVSQDQYLRVGSWVIEGQGLVMGLCCNAPIGSGENSAHWDLSFGKPLFSLLEGLSH